jgi:hypothetical protein
MALEALREAGLHCCDPLAEAAAAAAVARLVSAVRSWGW